MVTLNVVDVTTLIMGVVSIVLGVVSLLFGWWFYQASQAVNEKTTENLTKIAEKVAKIDQIVTGQFDKMLTTMLGIKYEGKVPIEGVSFLPSRKTKKK